MLFRLVLNVDEAGRQQVSRKTRQDAQDRVYVGEKAYPCEVEHTIAFRLRACGQMHLNAPISANIR